ncbi:hypothetical protein JN535_11375 [Cellulosimicrobium cellulans]|uniref:hypothetical protein n=1 Tax=Cellulosimicrobium cellulans TaxID=1710 RepID=UPI001965C6FF|nr:hypothetical protein [Cellulosimicrobium cellulans]MBN0040764.1 hypothetical protein [Cellulosimicrobium cellulans]
MPSSSSPRASRPTAVVVALVLALGTVLALAAAGALPASAQAETGRLSLFKRIENLDTGSSEGRRELWTMHARHLGTGEVVEGDGLNGVQSLEVPAGTYRIWETGGVAGFRFQNWNCGGEDILDPTPEVVVPPGGTLTCTVDNEAISPTLTLVKEVVGGTASPEEWTLRAQGPSSIAGPSGSDAVTNQAVRIGQYTLSEEGDPVGYRSEGWRCDGAPLSGDVVTLDLGRSVTCTVRNVSDAVGDEPTLTLVKEVVGGPAAVADWTLSATGPEQVSGATGDPAVTAVVVEPGEYALTEQGPAGYAATWSCTGAAAGEGDGGTVTVAPGEHVTCTATNTWQGGTLTLVKQLAGTTTAVPADWTLTAAGGATTVTGPSGSPAVTAVPVPPGDYALSESGWTGFDPGAWQCTGGGLDGAVVSVAPGATVVCTVTNAVVLPHLTLVKELTGGPTEPADWELAATGPQPDGTTATISGPSGGVEVSHVHVGAGDHTLAELTQRPDHEAGDWVCDGASGQSGPVVTIAPDDDVVCRVTNTYVGATLTLVKDVEGGSADPAAWTLTATDAAGGVVVEGASGTAATTRRHLPAGEYDLSESGGFSGYDSAGWSCTGHATLTGSTVSLPRGGVATCTVTNVAQLPHLTLVKALDDRGFTGEVEVTDWTLSAEGAGFSASGPSASAAVSHVSVEPGRYALAESGPAGWTSLGWWCEGARVAGSTVIVPPGADVVCTVTNHWLAGTLTLHKEVVDDVAPADDWELTAMGPTPLSGHDGAPDVTAVPVAEGTYRLSESGGEWDYAQQEWVCDGGELVGADTVRVDDGADVGCTVVNTVLDPPTPTPTPTAPTAAPTDGPTSDAPEPDGTATPGATPDDGLAATGSDVGVLLAVALAALLAGVVVLALRRRHGRDGAG